MPQRQLAHHRHPIGSGQLHCVLQALFRSHQSSPEVWESCLNDIPQRKKSTLQFSLAEINKQAFCAFIIFRNICNVML
jgi:hypothetical protein